MAEPALLPAPRLVDGVDLDALLAFEAPYLIDRLTGQHMIPSRDEAIALFQEVKKLLLVQRMHPGHAIPVFSRRVDEAWHQFVLYSVEYRRFCDELFGGYLHHAPAVGAPVGSSDRPAMGFEAFAAAYRALFDEPPSAHWHDERWVRATTRLLRGELAEGVSLRAAGDKVELVWHHDPERVLLRVDTRGERALRFVVEHGTFFVRELPGLLDDAERVAVCRPLVARRFLWVAP